MQSEIFQFQAATTQESMTEAVRVLSGVAGVSAVAPSLLRNEVSVLFDANLTAKQSVAAALANAGYALLAAGRTGGCGGGGGGCTCS